MFGPLSPTRGSLCVAFQFTAERSPAPGMRALQSIVTDRTSEGRLCARRQAALRPHRKGLPDRPGSCLDGCTGGTCSLRSGKDRGVGLEWADCEEGEKGKARRVLWLRGSSVFNGVANRCPAAAGAARCATSEDDSGTWSLRSRQSCPPARSGSPGCASAKGKVSTWARSDTQLPSSWGRGSGRDDFPPHSWLWPSAAHCPPPWLLSPSRLVTSSVTSVQRWNLCTRSFLIQKLEAGCW